MKLSSTGKVCNEVFTINDKIIECVNEYKYLGIIITSNCQFTTEQKKLLEKSNKACFKLKGIPT